MKHALEKFGIFSAFVVYVTNLVGITEIKPVFAAQQAYSCEYVLEPKEGDPLPRRNSMFGATRCLVDKGPGQNAWVTIENISDMPVQLSYEEWHSRCDFSGGRVAQKTFNLKGGEKINVRLKPPGGGITCREVFIGDCLTERREIPKCHDLVRVTWTTKD